MIRSGFQGLVMDLGVSEGNDTAFYLAKGFKVIAVEADPAMCRAIRERFRAAIDTGALQVLNLAASSTFGDQLEIFVHQVHQGISGIAKRGEVPDNYIKHSVTTVDWQTLLAQAGLPRYVKIDIEGNEMPFLKGMINNSGQLPEFISVECHKFQPVEMLRDMGYKRFRLVDQNPPGGFQLPSRQMEGLSVEGVNFNHASGPFGLDLFGDGYWLDFDLFQAAWTEVRPQLSHTWFDCHAWNPN
jgi:FkbM family methyltransferase